MKPGQIVLIASWDGKTRPAIFLEQRGGQAVTLPFTSDRHVVRNGKAAHVAEWREIGLRRESWLWNFLQRVDESEMSAATTGRLSITRDLASRVALLFGEQLKQETVAALKRERAA